MHVYIYIYIYIQIYIYIYTHIYTYILVLDCAWNAQWLGGWILGGKVHVACPIEDVCALNAFDVMLLDHKIKQTSTKNLPKFGPTSAQNLFTIGPKSVPEPTSLRSPFWDKCWTEFGPNLGPSWGQNQAMLEPCWSHVGLKINF